MKSLFYAYYGMTMLLLYLHNRYCSSTHSDFVHGLSWHPTKTELITCGWDGNMLSHNIAATTDDHSLTTSLEMSVEMKQ